MGDFSGRGEMPGWLWAPPRSSETSSYLLRRTLLLISLTPHSLSFPISSVFHLLFSLLNHLVSPGFLFFFFYSFYVPGSYMSERTSTHLDGETEAQRDIPCQ